jgi:excisionase family DNA binding protein
MSEMHEATPVSQPFPHFERLVDSREAAALLQIHPKTLQRLARKGEIRAMRIGPRLPSGLDLSLRLASTKISLLALTALHNRLSLRRRKNEDAPP